MGVFISTDRTDEAAGTKNASYLFDGKVWNAGQDVPVEADADVVAYLPYNREVTDFRACLSIWQPRMTSCTEWPK